MASHNEIDADDIENEDDILARHKKERRNLQAQIQKLKHSVPKGDKKKKKEMTEQIARLEAELEAKQNKELNSWKSQQEGDNPSQPSEEKSEEAEAVEKESTHTSTGKKSKAQKRRDKKQVKDKAREERMKEQETENRQGPRQQEMNQIKVLLKERGLALHEIPADGNCLYNAISHQLISRSLQFSNEALRQKTAEYMRSHSDDFLPFLTHPDTGDMLSPEEFEEYCNKTAKSPAWGGQVELRALSEVLRVPIEVIQADTQPLIIGESMEGKPVTVIYHRHVYRLGEHYNSVLPADQSVENGEEKEGELT